MHDSPAPDQPPASKDSGDVTAPPASSDASPAQPPGGTFDATVESVSPSGPVVAEVVGDAEQLAAAADEQATPTPASPTPVPRRRRWFLPIALLLATCLSTFWTAAAQWEPLLFLAGGELDYRRTVIRHWDQGLTYMLCVVAILFAHEMGHFLMTLRYRVPASLPYFIPLPATPLGTLGAVIGMDGKQANRRQLFDIGIAGPLAGLLVAVPILIAGVLTIDLTPRPNGTYILDIPIAARWLFEVLRPERYQPGMFLSSAQLNPLYMAGWVGMLVTGLNMMPVSQLDGGHVLYTLFGRAAHVMARGLIFALILYVVFGGASIWAVMLVLVILIGIDHPPTADDSVSLGWFRQLLGFAALAIPILCLPPKGIWVDGM
jgi:Zn-dependent protease